MENKLTTVILNTRYKLLILPLMIICACKEPFYQQVAESTKSFLVVEGIINVAGISNITLTRSLKVADKPEVKGELKAAVQIEGEKSGIYPLAEKTNGLYSSASLNLAANQKYRLRVRTSTGQIYLSDFVPVKITPPIDSISWARTPDGVEIYANAHDDKKETRYYQWDFDEDWELGSIAYSYYRTTYAGLIEARPPGETPLMYTCYKHEKSGGLPLFSTVTLTSDLVYNYRLVLIPNKSDRLGVRYSIIVRQNALTKEAFEYLSIMRRNSQGRGSVFDAQPTEITGNIHNINDPNDIVIGFVQATTAPEKRIFITVSQVPGWDLGLGCQFVEVEAASSRAYFGDATNLGPYIPTGLISDAPVKFGGGTTLCMDCRLRGG